MSLRPIQNGTPQGAANSSAAEGQRRVVLTEEDYSQNLSKVIQRNYFPDVPRLEAQVAVQAARDDGDLKKVLQTRRAARRLQQAEELETQQERDLDQQAAASNEPRKRPRPLQQESLTHFHQRVTSEDNAEYDTIQKEEAQQRQAARLASAARALPPSSVPTRSLTPSRLLASDQFNPSPHRLTLTQEETKQAILKDNPLFFVPTKANTATTTNSGDIPLQLEQGSDLALMPPPNRNNPGALVQSKAPNTTDSSRGLVLATTPVELIPKQEWKVKIVPEATRFPSTLSLTTAVVRPRPSLQDGFESAASSTGTDSETDLDATPLHSLATERQQALRRQQREHEALVEMTPVIIPGGGGRKRNRDIDDSTDNDDDDDNEPIMTWGEVSQTPLLLSGGAGRSDVAPGPSFDVPEASTRETAAEQAISDLQRRGRRAAQASSAARKRLSPQPHPRLSRLSSGLSSSARSSRSFGTALRASYSRPTSSRPATSSSSRRSGTTSVGRHRTAHAATPQPLKKF